jgi:GT2 family glycosyltransferase
MTYDIIIVTVNNNDYLLDCIDSIRLSEQKWPTNGNVNVMIVMNGCTCSTKGSFYDWLSDTNIGNTNNLNINVIENELMASFSAANNIGIKATRGDYVCILNDDTVVTSEDPLFEGSWLELLADRLSGRAACVGPVGAILDINAENKIVYNMDATKNGTKVDYIALCCAMVKRDLFYEIGYLDEGFRWALWEDVDFGVRIQKAGYSNTIMSYGGFHHYGHATIGKMDNEDKRKAFYANRGYFLYKHRDWLEENK